MKPLLLLVDLQEEFLSRPGLVPHRHEVTARAAALLAWFRSSGLPVAHAALVLRREPDRRMAHWVDAGRWSCLEGAPGAAFAPPAAPIPGERVLTKSVFTPWIEHDPHRLLHETGADRLLIAGVHLHACVRTAAIDAYQRGIPVWIVEDACGSDQPLAAAQTLAYLGSHGIGVTTSDQVRLGALPEPGSDHRHADRAAGEALAPLLQSPATPPPHDPRDRAGLLAAIADGLERERDPLAAAITGEMRKPIRHARAEVDRAAAILRAVSARIRGQPSHGATAEAAVRRPPLGVVALVTPYNNPLAVPIGLWAPAFAHGNRAVWKPAPHGAHTAALFLDQLRSHGIAASDLTIAGSAGPVGLALARHPAVDAVCFTGSAAAGWRYAEACAAERKPLHAELGGNNGAIVWDDAPAGTAEQIAQAAFGCASQRCTAVRRLILPESLRARFLAELVEATARLALGPPEDPRTEIGPLVSRARADEVRAVVARAAEAGHRTTLLRDAPDDPVYHPPTLVECDDAAAEIVTEETFGPVLVIQTARGWDHAMELLEGVPQGLSASLFSRSRERQQAFREQVRCGLLRINAPPAGAGIDTPFGGWKASGTGHPHHGEANLGLFTRWQAIYTGDTG